MICDNPVRIWLIIGLISVLAACGGGGTATATAPVALKSIDGNWAIDCFPDGATFFKIVANFNQGMGSAVTTIYTDAACTTVMMIDPPQTMTYVLGEAVTVDGSVAGITSATQFDSTDTTPGPEFGEVDYDLVAIKDNKLYVGYSDGANDGTTPTLRPTQLDPDIVLTKM
jgi:hypothetical protein